MSANIRCGKGLYIKTPSVPITDIWQVDIGQIEVNYGQRKTKSNYKGKCKNLYSVAEKMDIKRATFSKKINQSDGFDFTKCEKVTLMVILGIPYKELWGEEF